MFIRGKVGTYATVFSVARVLLGGAFYIILSSTPAFSQTPIDVDSLQASYVESIKSAEISTVKIPCAAPLNCGANYLDTYQSSDGNNQGDLMLEKTASFRLSSVPYNLRFASRNIHYQRSQNPIPTTVGVDLIQYEVGAVDNSGEPNNRIDVLPAKRLTSEEALRDQVINNGNESIFHNFRTSYQLVNTDIERIDVIFNGGIKTMTPENAGFLIIERGGNDNIQLAAVTALDGAGKPAAYGRLEKINTSDWARGINRLIRSISYVSDDHGVNYGAFGVNSLQYITANFMSLQDLGIGSDEVIFGYSIFPGDVDPVTNPTQNLLDPETLPKDTAGADGGLDLLYASGAFDHDRGLQKANAAKHIPTLSRYSFLILILSLMLLSWVKLPRLKRP